MPYVDKILKAAYQKRTATPRMREWREKNRQHHRKYMREWARKRRADKSKREKDLEKARQSESYKYGKGRQKVYSESLHDVYVIGLATRRSGLSRDLVKQNPELIELHRLQTITRRKLKTI